MVGVIRTETMHMTGVDRYQARIEYGPGLDQFRGEIPGSNDSADIYGNSTARSWNAWAAPAIKSPCPMNYILETRIHAHV
jgi:hypothetical protein